ncbi:DUF5047 domain-containing protein [Streptomyces sp. NBC_00006]|uniref:DUF5047 domain-containing protein n=1 Tax=Streptomyces sp. NBC_00006 TaxID=2975619 RepID=UPI00225C2237|nr:DUF5047 domain-containing protein [Streptomyces sp. NBC_00006]MCX5537715.1 DUF5047 domain-containing protein [Streptomyces sp. NBC_00006]MCX5537874.1 DUF5047 domain-containing protein [Streptomyces sp. NBC_00006]
MSRVQLFLTDGRILDLDHTGGSVSVDRAQAIRRTCSVTVTDPALIPRTATDKLATYGSLLRISRGVEYGDGTQELAPLGMFRLDSVDGDIADGPVTLQGKAIECFIADDKFFETYTATGTVVGAITALITRTLPGADVISYITDTPIGSRAFDIEADPWAGAQEIAAAAGAEVYTNADGVFVISQLPDLLTATPVWAVEATEGGVYVSGNRAMASDNVYNGVLARGENTADDAPPVSALIVDNDPGSPTRWGGAFGRRTKFISSSTLTTVNACSQAAALELVKAKAPNASGDFSSLPNPALEPGDVIRVLHPDGVRELHQVASFSVPLDTGGDFPITTISAKEDA